MLDKNKEIIQTKINAELQLNGGGLVVGATGIGKTKIYIDYAKSCVFNKRILMVVPSEALRDVDMPQEFKKWWPEANPKFVCYPSLGSINDEYDVVIVDEAHHCTDKVVKELRRIIKLGNSVVVGGTATYPKGTSVIKNLKSIGLQVVYEIPLGEAIRSGLVPKPTIKVVKISLSKELVYYTKRGFKSSEERMYKFYEDTLMAEYMKIGYYPKQLLMARSRFLASLDSKGRFAKILYQSRRKVGHRVIVFAGGTSQSVLIGEEVYHSASIKDHYENFVKKESNGLIVIEKLTEGVNNIDANIGIILSIYASPRRTVQKMGRMLRGMGIKVIYLFVAENTVEEGYVQELFKELDIDFPGYYSFTK